MFNKQKNLIGLDIGTSSVKAVELTTVGKDAVLTAYGQADIPSAAARGDAIVDVLQNGGFRTRRVATAVSGKSVIVRYLSMAKMSDHDLQNAIKFEADKYIPFDLDDVVLDAQKLEGGDFGVSPNEMRVLLVAVKRNIVEEHIQFIQSIGLQPSLIDVDAFALGNAWSLRTEMTAAVEDPDKVVALLDVGSNKTNINIVRGGDSYFTREIYLGGDDLTSAISKRMGCEMHQAEDLKRSPGENAEQVRDAVLAAIDDLANEIHLSFDYFENQFDKAVDEVLLSGGGARMDLVEETFEKVFEKRTRQWDPTDNLKVDSATVDSDALRANASQAAIAVGLASRIRKD